MLNEVTRRREALEKRGIMVGDPVQLPDGNWRVDFTADMRRMDAQEFIGMTSMKLSLEVYIVWAYRARVLGFFRAKNGQMYVKCQPTSPLSELLKEGSSE